MSNNFQFDWGRSSQAHISYTTRDLFTNRIYEKKFPVEEGDIVVDIGATVGEFVYSILSKKPKHCYAVEPISVFFDTLKKNVQGNPVSFSNVAISDSPNVKIHWDGYTETCRTLTFKQFIQENRLFNIDFLKVDCEGGEYDIFSNENIDFLKTIPKIVAEFHTGPNDFTQRFQKIKNNLRNFKKISFEDLDGNDITNYVFVNESWPEGHPTIKNLGYFNITFYADNR